MTNAFDPSVFEVVKIVIALLIQETTAIDVLHFLFVLNILLGITQGLNL